MPVLLDKIDIRNGQSLFVTINGSYEVMLTIAVSKDGRCFIGGPFNTKGRTFELAEGGFTETTREELHKALQP